MKAGRVLYAQDGQQCYFKLIGAIRHPVSAGFNAVINKMFREGQIKFFIIDMQETDFIDSTNLGLLAKIARGSIERNLRKPIIVTSNEDIVIIMASMGLNAVFTIVDEYGRETGELEDTLIAKENKADKARLIIEAHKILMEMNEKNREMFHDVVELLEKETPQDQNAAEHNPPE